MTAKVQFIIMAEKYLLTTLGCKVNQYESQQIREVFESVGFTPANAAETPHVAVVNTCAVTSTASRKSRQAIRRLTFGGSVPVLVVGCAASSDTSRIRNIEGVAEIFCHGTDALEELRQWLIRHQAGVSLSDTDASVGPSAAARACPSAPQDNVWMKAEDPLKGRGTQAPTGSDLRSIISANPDPVKVGGRNDTPSHATLTGRISRFDGHQRAFLKVQDGCDATCTYCIVPQLRTILASKPIQVAVSEAETLVSAGHREIVVTGVHLGAFGYDTCRNRRSRTGRSPLAELVESLAQVPGLLRLRLSSLEPGDVDDDLLSVLAGHDVCVPHLHLPLQAGSATILRRMGRHYSRDDFQRMIERVTATLDSPAITTDLIVGFPGETEEDFQASLQVARLAGFCKIHAFPYSPRPGTPAASWQKQWVIKSEIRHRMERLAALEAELAQAFWASLVGRKEAVLVEQVSPIDTRGLSDQHACRGRADRYVEVSFHARGVHTGDCVPVRIESVTEAGVYASPLG